MKSKMIFFGLFFVIFGQILAQDLGSNSIVTENLTYSDEDGFTMIGLIAWNPSLSSLRKTVLIAHDWNGRDDYENGRAKQLAKLGYVGFAMDVYGNGAVGKTADENQKFMKPLLQNRTLLLQRLNAGLAAVRRKNFVDSNKISAIGYCFGGLSVLDLARSNSDVRGVVSFHGNLSPMPAEIAAKHQSGPMKPKVLVLTGYNDPGVTPETVSAFEKEMDDRKADWEVNSYGDTVHSFTVPGSNVPGRAMYSERADKRSWAAMQRFFDEIFRQ